MAIENTEGFVLIGGASSRMGRSKAEMEIGGRKLFERSIDALCRSLSGRVAFIGKPTADFACDHSVIDDIRVGSAAKAPLIGLLTALTIAKTPWIAILACDMPFVTAELISRIADHRYNDRDAVVPLQPDSRPQPLCAFYRRERCLPVVEAMIKRDEMKMQQLLSHIGTNFVPFDDIADLDGSADFFVNVNDPTDYENAVRRATESSLPADARLR